MRDARDHGHPQPARHAATGQGRRARTARLRLISTTDLHGTIWPFDYVTDRALSGMGLDLLAPMIAQARSENALNLLCDTGDMLQGSALAERAAGLAADDTHPLIAAMNPLGYDAAALGNHDFNYGLDLIESVAAQARFPMLCANLVRSLGATPLSDTPFTSPSVVVERVPQAGPAIRIGLIGVAPPQIVQWDSDILKGAIAARGIVATVAAHAADLRRKGCDLVVVLCHSGLGAPHPDTMAEDAALATAALPDVDTVLAGHSHDRHAIAAADGTAPIVMAGALGSDLGLVDLDLAHDGARWHVTGSATELRSATGSATAPRATARTGFGRIARKAHEATRRDLAQRIGETPHRLHGLFPLSAEAPARRFTAAAHAWRARDLVAGTPLAGLPILSAATLFESGGVRGPEGFVDIPAGPFLRRHVLRLSPFPNRLTVLGLTGAQLRLWLEHTAAILPQVAAGARDADLGALTAPAYNFDVIHGLAYAIDLTRPAGARIAGLAHDGRPVAPGDRFAVATNSYRAAGGGGLRAIPPDAIRLTAEETLRQTLADFVAAGGEAAPGPPVFALRARQATVILRSAPHAQPCDHRDAEGRVPEPLCPDAEGYARFRLAL